MFLLTQIGLLLLAALLLGFAAGSFWRGRQARAVRADFQESLQAAEFRHSEQLAVFGADHEQALAALAQARHDVAATLEETRLQASSVQAQLSVREQQLRDVSAVLLKANQDLAKGESVRRNLLLERQRSREEVETLRKQVVTTRAELAQMLGLHEKERLQLQAELAAERQRTAGGPPAEPTAAAVAEPIEAVRQERDLLLGRMNEMVGLLQKAQAELEQRTGALEALRAPGVPAAGSAGSTGDSPADSTRRAA